jgi:hypothetical protein
MKNCFQTIQYKGEYIQTCMNGNAPEITWNSKSYKSLHAVKIAITSHTKQMRFRNCSPYTR